MPDRFYDRRLTSDGEVWRDPLERDYDAILYSSSWRRLRGVTQVIPITDGISRTHDRLTHSLKVAQVGSRLAQYVQYLHPTMDHILPQAVVVAGMAHDLGHPPFGHVAEKELQACLARDGSQWALADSFEGNAQTFRILTRLSRKASSADVKPSVGLNLTAASLAACTKYPWGHLRAQQDLGDHYKDRLSDYYDKKWGFYDDDEAAWSWTRERALVAGEARSVNAVIMDIADDVTYAVHDVHDHFRAGLIPLHEFGFGITGRHESDEYKQFKAYADAALNLKPEVPYSAQTMVRAQQWLAKLQFPSKAYADTMEDRSALHNFESSAMKLVQNAVEVTDTSVDLPPHVTLALELLKELTWYYVINHPALSASQEGQRRIIRDLHEWLCEWASECYSGDKLHGVAKTDRNLRRLPARFRELLGLGSDAEVGTDGRISRAAVDFVVGLTDAEATNLHHHLGGSAPTVAPVTWL